MLRKTVSVLLMICAGLYGAAAPSPWGALAGEGEPQARRTKPNNAFHILRKLSSGKPVKVFLEFEEKESEKYRTEYENELRYAYNDWFDMTRFYIDKTGKREKFLQILRRLQKGVQIQFVFSPQEADLKVFIMDSWLHIQSICSDKEEINLSIEACVSRDEKIPTMYIPSLPLVFDKLDQVYVQKSDEELRKIASDYFDRIWRHEIGHTLGLADQYEDAIPEATSHRMYRSTHIRKGIMNEEWGFTCDDADGIVNLIDIMYGVEPNRKQGWHSLCEDSPDVYVNGVAQGTGPYVIARENETVFLEIYKDGKKKNEKKFSFDSMSAPLQKVPDREVLEQDGLDRPVKTKGPEGEEIYYHYNYDTVKRLITKNEKVLRWEYQRNFEYYDKGTSQFEKEVYINWEFRLPDGQIGTATALINNIDLLGTYEQGPHENPQLSIEISSDNEFDDNVKISGSALPDSSENIRYSTLKNKVSRKAAQEEIHRRVEELKKWLREEAVPKATPFLKTN